MKKSIFILAAAALVSFTSCKENAADKVNGENVAATAEREAAASTYPVMTFTESEFDFGTIDQGTPQEHIFTFKNDGDADLIIVDAKSSCGCTVPEFTKDPVAPGATGELLVKFNGSGKNQVSKTVTITTNTASGKETVKIKAFVTPKDGATSGSPIQTK